ncbi:MAG: discoidin domain-containing protein [Clostridiales bacterium]|nr:discoidin domain-containing protein [Clostridiales bacterium]
MYLAYLIAALFILAFFALQKFVGADKKLSAVPIEVKAETEARSKSKKNRKNENRLKSKAKSGKDITVRAFVITGVIAFLVRVILAYYLKGYPSDMSCWIAWGTNVLNNGPGHFYAPGYFCDYPPGYVTVLGIFAWFNKIFGISGNGTQLIFKMPAILADIALMVSVFVIGSKHIGKKQSLILGIILMINPLLFINSSAWGQVESVLAVFLILAMYQLYKKNYLLSGALYVIAVLMKPQALMVGPVFLFAFVASKDWKMILKMIGIGIVMVFLFSVPFNYEAWSDSSIGFGTKLITALNPMWLIEKYMNTLGSYKYFSINAFNFYTIFKLNWVSLEVGGAAEVLLNILNYAMMFIAVAGALVLFIKIKSPSGKIFIPSFFIISFLFTFGLKMHERYLITPIIFLIFEYILSKNKRTLFTFAAFSSVNFINVFCILRYMLMYNTSGPSYSSLAFASVLEVITFIISMFVILHDYVLYPELTCPDGVPGDERTTSEKDKKDAPLNLWISKAKTAYLGFIAAAGNKICDAANSIGSKNKSDKSSGVIELGQKTEKMLKLDYLILAVIVVVYSVVAYVNLGSLKNPQTFYKPSTVNETVSIDLGSNEQINTVTYYLGIGDVGNKPAMKLSYSTDGTNWKDMNVSCQLNSVFKWEVVKLNAPVTARYIKGVSSAVDYRMFEVAFWRADGTQINIQSVSGPGDCANIADEQDLAVYRSSFQNSTYFDEIYHPRTAYEHLHLMPYYETTHPPLGKLIMSVGIAIFGMTPFGWRVMGTTFGILMLPLMYIMLKKLFERTRYSVLGTLIFAFDFMHFSLTRLGTIDSYPVTFIIAMYLFMFLFGKRVLDIAKNNPSDLSDKKTFWKLMKTLGLSGLMFGFGAASKWISIYAGAGLAVELLLIMIGVYIYLPQKMKNAFWSFLIKTCGCCIVLFVVIPGAIYTLSYLPISMVDRYPNVFKCMLDNQKYMFNYHSGLQATHPYSSEWYQWPIDYRPLWAYAAPVETVGEKNIGCISIFGNPLVFWSSIAAFLYTVVVGIIKRDKKVLFLVVGLMAQILPWVFVKRCVFIYHFFASLPFLIMMIVYTLKDLEERFGWFKHISNAFVVLCGLLFVAFYPVLSGMTITKEYSNTWLKWFNTWVFHNRGN